MKTTEEHLDDYLDKYNKLKKKNELWRLRVTPEKFLTEIERIRAYGIEQRKNNYLNEYAIQKNQEGMIAVMLMDVMKKEETIAQFKRIAELNKKQFALEALPPSTCQTNPHCSKTIYTNAILQSIRSKY
jgi:hypothetical protein